MKKLSIKDLLDNKDNPRLVNKILNKYELTNLDKKGIKYDLKNINLNNNTSKTKYYKINHKNLTEECQGILYMVLLYCISGGCGLDTSDSGHLFINIGPGFLFNLFSKKENIKSLSYNPRKISLDSGISYIYFETLEEFIYGLAEENPLLINWFEEITEEEYLNPKTYMI